jgi:hypothetical protein
VVLSDWPLRCSELLPFLWDRSNSNGCFTRR